MQKMIPALTERQRYWLEYIQACEAAGQNISQYAAEKSIAVQTMSLSAILRAPQLGQMPRLLQLKATKREFIL